MLSDPWTVDAGTLALRTAVLTLVPVLVSRFTGRIRRWAASIRQNTHITGATFTCFLCTGGAVCHGYCTWRTCVLARSAIKSYRLSCRGVVSPPPPPPPPAPRVRI